MGISSAAHYEDSVEEIPTVPSSNITPSSSYIGGGDRSSPPPYNQVTSSGLTTSNSNINTNFSPGGNYGGSGGTYTTPVTVPEVSVIVAGLSSRKSRMYTFHNTGGHCLGLFQP